MKDMPKRKFIVLIQKKEPLLYDKWSWIAPWIVTSCPLLHDTQEEYVLQPRSEISRSILALWGLTAFHQPDQELVAIRGVPSIFDP